MTTATVIGAIAAFGCAVFSMMVFEQVTRPLQTLANLVSGLRDNDFSFRSRAARRNDSLGDLALELNLLAGAIQAKSDATRDALTLAEIVMGAMAAPVLAFSEQGIVRVANLAAEAAFGIPRTAALGRSAQELGIESIFVLADGAVYVQPPVPGLSGEMRWAVRKSKFRLGGTVHHLLVLSNVNAALREEERVAWQKLVRVLSHEINNSLTPITSIAGSLRLRLRQDTRLVDGPGTTPLLEDLRRGLHLIQERGLALHRFLQSYQELTRLPRPQPQLVRLSELVRRVVGLEVRLAARVTPGPEIAVLLDPAQIEQLLINVLRNAVDAATTSALGECGEPQVAVTWSILGNEVSVRVEDNGPGVTDMGNLFVPFYTTKPHGSGIGLALAKQIATGHYGTLTLANRVGKAGCLAELRLPLEGSELLAPEIVQRAS